MKEHNGRAAKSGLDPIRNLPIGQVRPSPENCTLYRPVDPKDPEFQALVKSVKAHGVKDALRVTQDNWIISGHRRHAAARLAGLKTVPCQVEPINKDKDHDRFMALLRECNRQRVKTFDEKLREEIVSTDPKHAYRALIEHRNGQAALEVETLALRGEKRRAELSPAKRPFLDAVLKIIEGRKKFWPLSDRQIHYPLLNDPPLIHAKKARSVYGNTLNCYKALVDLLTRARLVGLIPMNVIQDETRPVTVWDVHPDVQGYLHNELQTFLKGYWRDLMQSQPNHVEIVGEKNTVGPIIRPIAAKYCIPTTIGRGFCSLPPRAAIADRYRKSGKERLILLIVSDFDPDGEEIAHSLARSLRDDFGIDAISPIKVALTADQVQDFSLPPMMTAKKTSTNYRRFADTHGDQVYELEALPPETLQGVLQEAIDAVIDVEAFNREVDQEEADAANLEATRRAVCETLKDFGL